MDPRIAMLIALGPAAVLLVLAIYYIEKAYSRVKNTPKQVSPEAFRFFRDAALRSTKLLEEYLNTELTGEDPADREAVAILGGKGTYKELAGHIFANTVQKMKEEQNGKSN